MKAAFFHHDLGSNVKYNSVKFKRNKSPGLNCSSVKGDILILYFLSRFAKQIFISIIANLIPRQILGPPENPRKVYFVRITLRNEGGRASLVKGIHQPRTVP